MNPKTPSPGAVEKSFVPAQPAATQRTRRRRRPGLPAIPALLLEGDDPPAGDEPGLNPPPSLTDRPATPEATDLPEAYGTKRLLLMARDPQWLSAHWDLTREQRNAYNALASAGHLGLRIYRDAAPSQVLCEVALPPDASHWFVQVPHAGTHFLAELGYHNRAGEWVTVSMSQAAMTPPNTLAEDGTIELASFPSGPTPRAVAIQADSPAASRATPAQTPSLREPPAPGNGSAGIQDQPTLPELSGLLLTLHHLQQTSPSSLDVLEIEALIRRGLPRPVRVPVSGISSGAVLPEAGQAAFGAAPGPGAGVSSPGPGAALPAKPGFWLKVNAELVIYGATEPDAQLTIRGRPIKLRPDGSFSFRFSLPDGEYDLPVRAVSADGTDTRAADLHFSRATLYRGEVGASPQSPLLEPPHLANLA